MDELNLKQGDRRIVNGQERAYHGSFGKNYEFVRDYDVREIEYTLFSNLEENRDGSLKGEVVRSFKVHPVPAWSIVFASGSDLYTRGKRILEENKESAA